MFTFRPKYLQYKYIYDYRKSYYDDVLEAIESRRRGKCVSINMVEINLKPILRICYKYRQAKIDHKNIKYYANMCSISVNHKLPTLLGFTNAAHVDTSLDYGHTPDITTPTNTTYFY